jgi:hypothetical protein
VHTLEQRTTLGKGTSPAGAKDSDADSLSVHRSSSLDTDTESLIEHLHFLESVVEMSPTAILTTDLEANVTS